MKKCSVVIILFLLALSGLWGQKSLKDQFEEVQNYKADIYRQTQQFILDNPNSPNLPKLYYNLAEISSSLYRETPSITLNWYKKVLEADPNFYDKEIILYNIAYYSYKMAKDRIDDGRPLYEEANPTFVTWPDSLKYSNEVFSEAKDFYAKVIEEYSYTDYYDESIFKLALIFSDIATNAEIPLNYYKKSAAFLSILINRDDEISNMKTDALFQRAWAYYQMSDWDNAITDFASILKDDRDYTKLYYHDFAVENVAYSLVGIDSTNYLDYAKSADAFINNYASLFTLSINQRIFDEVINLKLDLNAPMQAGDYYFARISLDSLNISNPTYIDSVLDLYSTYASYIRDGKEYRDVVKEKSLYAISSYGYNSDWYNANRNNHEFMSYFNSVRNKFERLETFYSNDLINQASVENYKRYIDLINAYAEIPEFKDEAGIAWLTDKSDKMINFGFNLAENTGQTEYYLFTQNLILTQEAASSDTTVSYEKEYMLFSATDYAYNKLSPIVADSTYFDEINNIEITKSYLDSLYVAGASRFYEVITSNEFYTPEQDNVIKSILWNRSIINRELENDDMVVADLNELLKYQNEKVRTRDIYVLLAQLHEKKSEFNQSEGYYAEAQKYANDEEDQKELKQSYLAQINKNVDRLADTADYITAANEQLRLASKFDPKTDKDRVYDLRDKARQLFFKGGDYQNSIDILLENAEFKTELKDIHSLYYNAWAIADTVLSDTTQVISIQNRFVSKFPESNESFTIILNQLKEKENSGTYKYDAAAGYLELHNTAKNGKIDIGENKTEDIYKMAINIYLQDETANQDTLISLMSKFEKIYPDDPSSMDYLKFIAKAYYDTDKDKYEQIAHYIYEKDPSVDLYSAIAFQKIDKVVKEADVAFKSEDWDSMNAKIDEVRKLESYYSKKGVNLTEIMPEINKWFDYYAAEYKAWQEYQQYLKDRADFLASYDKRLTNLRNSWLNANDKDIFRVNHNTKFRTHVLNKTNQTVSKDNNRIQYVYQLASKKEGELVKLLQEAAEWNIDIPRKVRLLYISGEIWEHAAKVVDRRMEFYFTQSNEIYNLKQASGKDQVDNVIELQLKPMTDSFVELYREESRKRYLNLYNFFVDGTGYTDKNIETMMPKIADLVPQLDVNDMPPDTSWFVENNLLESPDSLYVPTKSYNEISQFVTPRNLVLSGFEIRPYNSVFASCTTSAEILPAKAYIQFAYPDTANIKFWVNDTIVKQLPVFVDSLTINNQITPHYLYKIDYSMLKEGTNKFEVKADNISDTTAVLALNMQVAFDSETLNYHRTTAEDKIISGSEWKMSDIYIPSDSMSTANSEWIAVESFEQIYPTDKIYDMESTSARWIYATSTVMQKAEIDSTIVREEITEIAVSDTTLTDSLAIEEIPTEETKTYVKYFKKDFIGYQEVIKASLKFAAVEKATIWLNGIMISEEIEAFTDEENNAIFSNPVDIDPAGFNSELNSIVVKVESSKKQTALILDMNLVYKKGGE